MARLNRLITLAFIPTVILGAGIFWLSPYPPMTDLPQHAAQLVMLKALLAGPSPWADLFRLNPFTPFLLATTLVLPLSFLMPVTIAFKLVLSLAYIAFVTVAVKLGRQLGSDPRLNWMFLIGFFGFSYSWGFVTFLVAAPLGLYFILQAVRYAAEPTRRQGIGLTVLGTVMLASHGLIFAFGWLVGFLMLVTSGLAFARLARMASPYLVLGVVSLAMLALNKHGSAGQEAFVSSAMIPDFRLTRIRDALQFTVRSGSMYRDHLLYRAVILVGILAPWLFGLRIDWRRRASLVPLGTLVVVLMVVPSKAFNTFFLYQRFALFLPAVYAFAFACAPAQSVQRPRWLPSAAVSALLAAACWGALGNTAVQSWRFGEETKDFEAVMAPLESGQRALSLVFDRDSDAADSDIVYTHFPAWYQAKKGGLIEFNFAWFPPQIVRYRPDRLPTVEPPFAWSPDSFDWNRHHGERYRYFFVRAKTPVRADLFAGAHCVPVQIANSGEWTVYERQTCPESPASR